MDVSERYETVRGALGIAWLYPRQRRTGFSVRRAGGYHRSPRNPEEIQAQQANDGLAEGQSEPHESPRGRRVMKRHRTSWCSPTILALLASCGSSAFTCAEE